MAFFSSRQRADAHSTLADDGPVESEQSMRRRARQRLIGSVVLVSLAFGAFSLLFDNQPRAISVDVPIEIPDKRTAKPLVMPSETANTATAALNPTAVLDAKEQIVESEKPAAKPAAAMVVGAAAVGAVAAATVALKADAPAAPASASPRAIADAQARAAAAKALQDKAAQDKAAQDKARAKELSDSQAAKAQATKEAQAKAGDAKAADAGADAKAAELKASEQKAALAKATEAKAATAQAAMEAKDAKDAKARADAARAKALLEGQGAGSVVLPGAGTAKSEPETTRYIVQFGAFSEPAKAQETRKKVERTGLKTYAQEANTADGKRIRVRAGPFATRAEADAAASKIKALGLPVSVLTL